MSNKITIRVRTETKSPVNNNRQLKSKEISTEEGMIGSFSNAKSNNTSITKKVETQNSNSNSCSSNTFFHNESNTSTHQLHEENPNSIMKNNALPRNSSSNFDDAFNILKDAARSETGKCAENEKSYNLINDDSTSSLPIDFKDNSQNTTKIISSSSSKQSTIDLQKDTSTINSDLNSSYSINKLNEKSCYNKPTLDSNFNSNINKTATINKSILVKCSFLLSAASFIFLFLSVIFAYISKVTVTTVMVRFGETVSTELVRTYKIGEEANWSFPLFFILAAITLIVGWVLNKSKFTNIIGGILGILAIIPFSASKNKLYIAPGTLTGDGTFKDLVQKCVISSHYGIAITFFVLFIISTIVSGILIFVDENNK